MEDLSASKAQALLAGKWERILLPSPDDCFMAFDFCMIVAFIGGWSFTILRQVEVLGDNPILRAFQANNICVGVDKGGARIAANLAWGVMLVPLAFYLFTAYLQMFLYEDGRNARTDAFLMVLAYFMLMTFGICFGIEPEYDSEHVHRSVMTVKTHTWGFCIALLGYALTRIVEIRLFQSAHKNLGYIIDRAGKRYINALWFHFGWCLVGSLPLLKTLIFDDLAIYLVEQPEANWFKPMSILMWTWTLGILLLPIVVWWFGKRCRASKRMPLEAVDPRSVLESGTPLYL